MSFWEKKRKKAENKNFYPLFMSLTVFDTWLFSRAIWELSLLKALTEDVKRLQLPLNINSDK